MIADPIKPAKSRTLNCESMFFKILNYIGKGYCDFPLRLKFVLKESMADIYNRSEFAAHGPKSDGLMRVVSGIYGSEVIHFETPPAKKV